MAIKFSKDVKQSDWIDAWIEHCWPTIGDIERVQLQRDAVAVLSGGAFVDHYGSADRRIDGATTVADERFYWLRMLADLVQSPIEIELSMPPTFPDNPLWRLAAKGDEKAKAVIDVMGVEYEPPKQYSEALLASALAFAWRYLSNENKIYKRVYLALACLGEVRPSARCQDGASLLDAARVWRRINGLGGTMGFEISAR